MLVTLHTLLNAIICCFQLNTEWGADDNRKMDYLGIDAVGLTVYVFCRNAQLNIMLVILSFICIAMRSTFC